MKARITALLATLVVALSLAAVASAAPHKTTLKGWDYSNHAPAATAGWTAYDPGNTKGWSVKPWASAGWTRAQV